MYKTDNEEAAVEALYYCYSNVHEIDKVIVSWWQCTNEGDPIWVMMTKSDLNEQYDEERRIRTSSDAPYTKLWSAAEGLTSEGRALLNTWEMGNFSFPL